MGLINGTVILKNEYETWKKMFEEEKKTLQQIFNDNSFRIEHVGSTAVEGLSAKPIVDIAVGVNAFKELDKYKVPLKRFYTIKDDLDNNEILLIKENNTETFFIIHVLLLNDDRYKNMIKFRNVLISNPEILKEYENLKKELAKKYFDDRKSYTKAKSDFINKIIQNQ